MTKYVIQREGEVGSRREIVEIWPLYAGEIDGPNYLGAVAPGKTETYDVGDDPDNGGQVSDRGFAHDRTHYAIHPAPLGAKRLPQVGEVWRNRNGALVAVMSAASILDGGYNCVTISKSESARNPGHVYVTNLDGRIHGHSHDVGGDLVSFVTRFDS